LSVTPKEQQAAPAPKQQKPVQKASSGFDDMSDDVPF